MTYDGASDRIASFTDANGSSRTYEYDGEGRLVPVLADHPLAGDHAIWALYPSAALMPPKLRVMLDFLAARFAAPPYWERGATDPA